MTKLTKAELVQMVLEDETEPETLVVSIKGHDVEFKWKPLLWAAKNRCVTAATKYGIAKDALNKPVMQGTFSFDVYNKLCLREMLIDPPLPITDQVYERLDHVAGKAFESIIPDPQGMIEAVEVAKNPSATSDGVPQE